MTMYDATDGSVVNCDGKPATVVQVKIDGFAPSQENARAQAARATNDEIDLDPLARCDIRCACFAPEATPSKADDARFRKRC